MEFKTVFGPGTGGPSDYYRIPSMITTKNGVVVACADARFFTGADNPNRIDKVVRRSMDSGETWEDYQTVVEEYGEEKNLSSAAIDPILTYSSDTGRIFMHYCHTPAGVGILNCNSCVGEDADGNKIISRVLKEDSFVYSSMTQLPDGNIGVLFEPDLECQNIWFTKFSLDWIKGKE